VNKRHLPRNFHSHEYGGVVAPLHWLLLPAYTVLPFIRSPLGMQLVHPRNTVVIRVVALIFLPLIIEAVYVGFTQARLPENMGHIPLIYFALAYLAVTLVLFARRWHGQRHGEELHSGEAGYSWLAWYSTLPVALCEQLIVPLAVGALGYVVAHTFSVELGWWLMAAGVSLFIMARWEYRRIWSQHQATVDDIVRASPDEPIFADLGDDDPPPKRRRGR
jgi:uncharacterized membrane protein YhaH (DUF805 family)